ncbi:MAG: Fe-S cluster assembly protein SufD [Solirubrobacteraceae bacterium]|nr:Fe-S cluster assembly protein SufD [Solirubrobacteraceae bacterium]
MAKALLERRERAAARVQALDVPTFKGRPGWEFTDLSGLELGSYRPAEGGAGNGTGDGTQAVPLPFGIAPADSASWLEQRDALSTPAHGQGLPDGVIVSTLEDAAAEHPELVERYLGSVVSDEDDVFVARNEAGFIGGAFVYVPRNVVVKAPIVLTSVQTQTGSELHRRTVIVLEEGAEAAVWEQYVSGADDLDAVLNVVSELVVGDAANLRYVCAQDLSEKSWIFGAQRAEVGRDAHLDWVALGFGSSGGHVRMETRLSGDGADARVTGAYATHARQHIDFDTTQEHAAPHTTSDLAFRGVLQGRSSAVWKGNIIVDPGAQKTDAFQDSRNLLLSKRAHADAIPGLEIQANDVRCTHAAAVAQVDPEQLFYLRSHGLPEPDAKRLVIEGFLAALVERFEAGPVREVLGEALERRLSYVLGG